MRVDDSFVVGWGDVYAAPFAGDTSRRLSTGVFVPATEPGAVWLTVYGQVQTPTERLVDMHRRVLLQGPTPLEASSRSAVPAETGIPGGLVLEGTNGLDIWDARTGRITRHLGAAPATAAPAFGSLLAWYDRCQRTLELTDLARGTTRVRRTRPPREFADDEPRPLVLARGRDVAFPAWPDAAAPSGTTAKIVVVDVSTGRVIAQVDAHAVLRIDRVEPRQRTRLHRSDRYRCRWSCPPLRPHDEVDA